LKFKKLLSSERPRYWSHKKLALHNFLNSILFSVFRGNSLLGEIDIKEEAKRISSRLLEELGMDEYKNVFERTNAELEASKGIQPSREEVVLAMAEKFARTHVRMVHDGKHWRTYYYPIESFEEDLLIFSRFLEALEENDEKVSVIIPNMGLVPTSIVLGTSFQGVKGFAVIIKRD